MLCKFVETDGGRAEAGYKGIARDCAARAMAVALEIPYQEAYDAINEEGKRDRITTRRTSKSSAREGVYRETMTRVLASYGWEWHATMKIGTGCRMRVRADEIPDGVLILRLSKHFVAVRDHTIYDLEDPSRDGTRCVYGYWKKADS